MITNPSTKREAVLYETSAGGKVRCNVCHWRCLIPNGAFGVCRMRRAVDGRIELYNYPGVASVNNDPVEKKPLFHFYPGSSVLFARLLGLQLPLQALSELGDIVRFAGGRAAPLARPRRPPTPSRSRSGSAARGSPSPTTSPASGWSTPSTARAWRRRPACTRSSSRTASARREALDLIGPYLDAFRVDVKGFSDEFYRDLAKVGRWREILDSTQYAREHWDMHVEVVTNIIPTMNDDDAQLRAIARWIRDDLGAVDALARHRFPAAPRARPPAADAARDAGQGDGHRQRRGAAVRLSGQRLRPPGREHALPATAAPVVISRAGYQAQKRALTADGRCANCGADLNIRTAAYQRRLPVSAAAGA